MPRKHLLLASTAALALTLTGCASTSDSQGAATAKSSQQMTTLKPQDLDTMPSRTPPVPQRVSQGSDQALTKPTDTGKVKHKRGVVTLVTQQDVQPSHADSSHMPAKANDNQQPTKAQFLSLVNNIYIGDHKLNSQQSHALLAYMTNPKHSTNVKGMAGQPNQNIKVDLHLNHIIIGGQQLNPDEAMGFVHGLTASTSDQATTDKQQTTSSPKDTAAAKQDSNPQQDKAKAPNTTKARVTPKTPASATPTTSVVDGKTGI